MIINIIVNNNNINYNNINNINNNTNNIDKTILIRFLIITIIYSINII